MHERYKNEAFFARADQKKETFLIKALQVEKNTQELPPALYIYYALRRWYMAVALLGWKKPFHFLFNSGGARAPATCCTYFSFLLQGQYKIEITTTKTL